MPPLSLSRLVFKRFADDWPLLASIFAGILIATTLAAAAPVYVSALERLGLNLAIDRLDPPFSNISIFLSNIRLTEERLSETETSLVEAADGTVAPIFQSRQRFLLVDTYDTAMPGTRLPRASEGPGPCCRSYFRSLTNLESHLTFLEGEMAGDQVSEKQGRPLIEAIISVNTSRLFQLAVGEVLTVTPAQGVEPIFVRISGIVEATDSTEDYWPLPPYILLDPPNEEEEEALGEEAAETRVPPAPLYATQRALVDAVGATYPTTLIDSVWIVLVDTERFKEWDLADARQHLDDFGDNMARAIPGSGVATRLRQTLNDFESTSFFSRVPLLLLLAIVLVTVFFYLAMIVSYLVHNRAKDSALLRTRGTGMGQLLRLYLLEGLLMTGVAVVVAPFLAIGIVAAAGKVLYLRAATGGEFLPVELGPVPFIIAGGAGLLCLSIVVLPGLIGARGALLAHKLRIGRPPTVPMWQRYNLDIGVLVLGGVVFWELQSRGHLISGGLFSEPGVNEPLLLAPILFLMVVGLLFMRLFPLTIRFLGGESSALVHLTATAAVLSFSAVTVWVDILDDRLLDWIAPVSLALAIGGAYWATDHARLSLWRISGLALQGALVATLMALERPGPGDLAFFPAVGLMVLVPAQVAFIALRRLTRVAPVWLSIGLWHMARNPLQYTSLVLLLVLVTGVGVLATTVGGTLKRNVEDRISYATAADVRVAEITTFSMESIAAEEQRFLSVLPGATGVSLALRQSTRAAAAPAEILAVDSLEFPYITWYREDFSDQSVTAVMGDLRSSARIERLEIPEESTSIGVWVNPREEIPNTSMWFILEEGNGRLSSLAAGIIGAPGWQLLEVQIPGWMRHPVDLVSLQLFEAGAGDVNTAGQMLIDDIHTRVGEAQRVHILDGFEEQHRWMPIVTSTLSPDRITSTGRTAHSGRRTGVFTFGTENQDGVRGFYQSPTGGPLPVVISAALAETTAFGIDDVIVVSVSERNVPMVVRGVIDYFPTMAPIGGRFILADLESLLGHVNVMSNMVAATPNELFVTQSPIAYDAVRDALDRVFRFSGRVMDKTDMLESSRIDPLATSGWNSMVLVALLTVIVAAGLGYATYLLLFASKSRSEIGFLQSMGLSRQQLTWLLAFEHLSIAVTGLVLGTWAGFRTTNLMVSSVAVSETGERSVPPFVLITDWTLMLPTYGVLLGIFVVAVVLLTFSARRLDLHAIERVEAT